MAVTGFSGLASNFKKLLKKVPHVFSQVLGLFFYVIQVF